MPDFFKNLYQLAKNGNKTDLEAYVSDNPNIDINSLEYGRSGLSVVAKLAKEGYMEAALLLLGKGASRNSFLYGLALGGHQRIIEEMKSKEQVGSIPDNFTKEETLCLIKGASEAGHIGWVRELLSSEEKEEYETMAITWAAVGGHEILVNELYSKNTKKSSDYLEILKGCAMCGAFLGRQSKLMKDLIAAGAEVKSIVSLFTSRALSSNQIFESLEERKTFYEGFAGDQQKIFIKLSKELGIPTNEKGICSGFATMAGLAGLTGDFNNFIQRLSHMEFLHNNLQLILDKKLPADSITILPDEEIEIPGQFDCRRSIKISLHDIETFLRLLNNFQIAGHSSFSFWGEDRSSAVLKNLAILMPEKWKDQKISILPPHVSHRTFSKWQLEEYLKDITHLDKSPAFLYTIGSKKYERFSHAVGIIYDAENSLTPWVVADANLGIVSFENDTTLLAEFIFSCFVCIKRASGMRFFSEFVDHKEESEIEFFPQVFYTEPLDQLQNSINQEAMPRP